VAAPANLDAALLQLLYDPQTSGGLLISLPAADAAALERRLSGAQVVGRVLPRDNESIILL
jgi:selenide,water dikinase